MCISRRVNKNVKNDSCKLGAAKAPDIIPSPANSGQITARHWQQLSHISPKHPPSLPLHSCIMLQGPLRARLGKFWHLPRQSNHGKLHWGKGWWQNMQIVGTAPFECSLDFNHLTAIWGLEKRSRKWWGIKSPWDPLALNIGIGHQGPRARYGMFLGSAVFNVLARNDFFHNTSKNGGNKRNGSRPKQRPCAKGRGTWTRVFCFFRIFRIWHYLWILFPSIFDFCWEMLSA